MIYDGIKLIEGSALQNLVIDTGTSFPSSPDEGELFVRTDAGNAGLYIYQNSAWSRLVKDGEVAGGATAVGASGTIQLSNGAGALTTLDNFRWDTSEKALLVDSAFSVYPADMPSGGATGRSLAIKGGTGGKSNTGGVGGALQLYGGSGGDGTTGNAGHGGALQLYGGNAGTNGNWPGNGGWVQLYGGQPKGSGTPGSVAVYTNNIERFRVSNTGAFGLSGANYGTSGQVLTSQGANSAPIWTTPNTSVSNNLVTLDTTQTITGNKTVSNATTIFTRSDNGPAFTRFVSSSTTQYFAGGLSVGMSNATQTDARYTQIYQYNALANGAATGFAIAQADSNNGYVRTILNYNYADQRLVLYTSGSARQIINSDGTVLVGTLSTPVTQANGRQAGFSVGNTDIGLSRMAVSIFRNDFNSAGITFTKSRGATAGTHGLVEDGDGLGFMPFEGSTGTAYARGAIISATVDGTASSSSMPGKLSFSTTPSGSLDPVERLAITASGAWAVNSSTGTAGQVLVSNGAGSSPSWQNLPNPTKLERVTTFDANALGKRVALSAGITIPSATYAAGDAFSFYNTTGSAITITEGAGLTLRQDGTTNTGNRTLAPFGTCFVWYNTTNEAIISGSVS